jgi:hypothetical protein
MNQPSSNRSSTTKKQMDWINIGKFIAILGVIVDYNPSTSNAVRILSYFSVSLFILLAGVTSYYSCLNHYSKKGIKETLRRVSRIFIPYAAATAIYQLFNHRFLDFGLFWDNLIHFNASLPFYFVLFYMELVFISPVLFEVIYIINSKCKKVPHNILTHIIMVIGFAGISALTIRYTLFPGVTAGSAFLFGGTYLILFYTGMVFASHDDFKPKTKPTAAIPVFIFSAGVFAWINFLVRNRFNLDTNFPFGYGKNPPGISLMIHALLIFALIFSLSNLLHLYRNEILMKVQKFISHIGYYSLYIFLYHFAVLKLARNLISQEGIVKEILIYISAVFVPVAFAKLYQKAIVKYKNLCGKYCKNL